MYCSLIRCFWLRVAGFVLSVGGFLLFMLNGSISAIRFGVILGGTLLALSVSSLRSWKKGESVPLALEGQAGQCLNACASFNLNSVVIGKISKKVNLGI